MKIEYRYNHQHDEFYEISAREGMIIAEKIDENGKYKEPRSFPHYDFSYVIFSVKSDHIEVRDTGANNLWSFTQEELKGYELVMEWHPNASDGIADYVNEALMGNRT